MPAPHTATPRAGQRSIWSADLGSFLQPDQYAYLSRGGTLWSWPGQNPFRWRDPSGRYAQGMLGPNLYFAGLASYLFGYHVMGPTFFAQQDAHLNLIAKAAARDRENQGRPNPGEACRTEAGGGGGRARIPPPVAAAADDPEPAGRLRSIGLNTWESSGGLVYGPDNFFGNRVQHVLAHTVPDASKPMHSVFNVGRDQVLGLVDEAWSMRGAAGSGDPGAFVVPMGRIVGTAGETAVRIVVRPGTNQIITAYPMVP